MKPAGGSPAGGRSKPWRTSAPARRRGASLLLVLALSFAPARNAAGDAAISRAEAGDDSPENPAASPGSHDLELAPPDLSGFALLGINPNQVTRPGTTREFSAAVLSGAQADGTITSALAVEWSPISSSTPDNLQAYRDNVQWRRITLSGAAVVDGTTTAVALGARWLVIDRSDPLANEALQQTLEDELGALDQPRRRAFLAEARTTIADHTRFKQPSEDQAKLLALFSLQRSIHELTSASLCAELKAFLRDHPGPDGADPAAPELAREESELCRLAQDYAILRLLILEDERAQREATTRRVAEVKEAMRQRVWNATTAQFGFGVVGRSSDSRWDSLRAERLRAFANVAPGIGAFVQLIFQADITRALRDGASHALGAGTRAVIGTADSHATAELYGQLPERGAKLFSGSLGGELRLSRNVWLEFQAGAQTGGDVSAGAAGMLTRANIKYGSGIGQ
jgi:hypothetical protein